MSRRLTALVAGGAIAACGASATAQTPPTGHEKHIAQMAAASKDPAARVMVPQPAIADIALVDQSGRATTLLEAIGSDKPVLVNFIFTTCTTICPVMSAGMSQFLTNLGPERDQVRVVSISIDPDVDTIEKLRAYATRYHAAPSWRFLTGTPEAIVAAQRAFGSYRGGKYNHAAGTFVRPAPDASWIALDGLSSAETLMNAFLGRVAPPQS